MKKSLVPISEVLKRQIAEGKFSATHIGKESFHQIGEGIHPLCKEGEEPGEIIILSDHASAFAVCAEHWSHVNIN